jgi:hypothetical protein
MFFLKLVSTPIFKKKSHRIMFFSIESMAPTETQMDGSVFSIESMAPTETQMDGSGIPSSVAFAANNVAGSVDLASDDDAESIVFSTGASVMSETTNEEKKKAKKKTPLRLPHTTNLREATQQSLLGDLVTHRNNSRTERLQLRRELNFGESGQAEQDTTTPTKKHNYVKKRLGIKEDNLSEINKAGLEEASKVARVKRTQGKLTQRRKDAAAAASAREAAASTAALGIDAREEAARVLAEVDKVEEERIAKEKVTQEEEVLPAATGQN